MDPHDFKGTTPRFILEKYFDGDTKASGIFEDRFGNIKRQFVVDMSGVWDGNTLTLDEHFVYSDGETERRVWYIEKIDNNTYEGRANDVIGVAVGKSFGNSLNWQYTLALNTKLGKFNVDFDDWMFLQPSGVVLNRATLSKFGFNVGTVTLSFQKKNDVSKILSPLVIKSLNNNARLRSVAQ